MKGFAYTASAAAIAALALACTTHCPERGYGPGERFRLTVLAADVAVETEMMPMSTAIDAGCLGDSTSGMPEEGPSCAIAKQQEKQRRDEDAACYFTARTPSFELIADVPEEDPICGGGGAIAAPPFWRESAFNCSTDRRGQLGMSCRAPGNKCPVTFEFYTYPLLQHGDTSRDDLELRFSSQNSECERCTGTLQIRVEALGAL